MKILVFSDSHGDADTMYRAVITENPDTVIHLGDHLNDGMELQAMFPGLTIRLVRGNTDFQSGSDEIFLEISNHKIYAVHGHLYNVKSGLGDMYMKGADTGADVILFGHTHIPFLEQKNGVWFMNPGRIGKKRHVNNLTTYGVITITEGLRCEIVNT